MRTQLRIILFGLALGLLGLALILIGYGIWTAGTATEATSGLAIGPIYAIATYRVALGCAALIGATILGGIGVLVRGQA